MADITAANAALSLAVPPIFNTPVRIQGFAAGDVFDLDAIESTEVQMGVDGVMSGGWTWKPQPQAIHLQADSPSNDFFDQIYLAQQAGQTVLFGNGVLILPSISKKFILVNGLLTTYKLPGARNVLTPRTFRFMWTKVLPNPL